MSCTLAFAWCAAGVGSAAAAPQATPPAAAGAASPVAACDLARIVGRYRFAGDAKEREAVRQAIDAVVAKMSFLARPFARSRLRKANAITQRLELARRGEALVVAFDGRRYSAPLSGAVVKTRGVGGQPLELRHRLERHCPVQYFRGQDGTRINRFSALTGGRLRLQVTISSSKLPQAVKYELTYRRRPSSASLRFAPVAEHGTAGRWPRHRLASPELL